MSRPFDRRTFIAASAALAPAFAADRNVEAIRAAGKAIIAADNASDIDALAALYTEDAAWFPPSGEPVIGRAAIIARYRQIFSEFRVELEIQSTRIEVSKNRAVDQGITRGRRISKRNGDSAAIHDQYLMTWQRGRDRRWRASLLAWRPVANA